MNKKNGDMSGKVYIREGNSPDYSIKIPKFKLSELNDIILLKQSKDRLRSSHSIMIA